MATPGLDELDAEFEQGLGQTPRPRAASPIADLDAEFEAGLQQAPRRPRSRPEPAAAPTGRLAPRLPLVTTDAGKPGEALFTPQPTPKPRPKPKPVKIPTVKEINLGGQDPGEAAYAYTQREYKRLPEWMRDPKYKPAEGGKVEKILTGRATAFQALKGNRKQIDEQHNRFAQQVMDQQVALNKAVGELNKRGATPAEKKAVERAQAVISQNLKRVNQRGQEIKSYWGEEPRVMARVRGLKPAQVHEGPYLPGEKAAEENRPLRRIIRGIANIPVFGTTVGEIANPKVFTDPKIQKRDQLIERAKATGAYPAMPLPKGREQRRELQQVRSLFFMSSPTEGLVPVQDVGEANWRHRFGEVTKKLTPYQKSLLPVFQKQWQAERTAARDSGLLGAMVADLGFGVVSELVGNVAGKAAVKAAEKRLAPAAAKALQKVKIPKWGAEKIVKLTVEAGSGGAVGGATGAVGAAAPTYVETRDLKQTVKAAKQGAKVGAAFGAGGAVLGVGAEAGIEARGRVVQKKQTAAATKQMAAATPGPKAKTASGVEVRLRHADPVALERAAGEFEMQRQAGALTPEGEQQLGRIRQWQEAQARREAQMRVELPPEEMGNYQKRWKDPKNPARAQRDQLLAQAEQLAGTNPKLADMLVREADEIHGEFIHDVLKGSDQTYLETPNPAHPTQVSPWRRLTDEEQAALPPQLRQALLMRDIQNSGRVLDPSLDAVYLPKDIGARSLADLEAKADSLYIEAQSHLDALYAPLTALPEPPVPQVVASGSQQVKPLRKRQVAPVAEPVVEIPTALKDLLDRAHGHVARRRDVSTLRPSELRGYLDRIQEIFDWTKEAAGPGEYVRGESYPRDWTEARDHLRRAGEALDRGDSVGTLIAGEQALQTLHPFGYDPKESPLVEIAGRTLGDAPEREKPKAKAGAASEGRRTAAEIEAEIKAVGERWEKVNHQLENPSEGLDDIAAEARSRKLMEAKDGLEQQAIDLQAELISEKATKAEAPAKAPLAPVDAPQPAKAPATRAKKKAPREITEEFRPTHTDKAGKPVEFVRDDGAQVRVRDSGGYGQQYSVPKAFFEKHFKPLDDTRLDAPDSVALTANPKAGDFTVIRETAPDGTIIARTEALAKRLENHPRAAELNRWVEANSARLQRVIEQIVRKVLPPEEAARVRHAGVGLLEWGGEPAFGANMHNAADVGGPTEILVGPFRQEEMLTSRTWYTQPSGGDNPRKLAREVVYTSLHEAAHNIVREEGKPLWEVMDSLYTKAGDDFFDQMVQEVTDVLTGGEVGGELSPGYLAARQVYLEVARGAGGAGRAHGTGAAARTGQAAGVSLSRGVSGGQRGVRPTGKRNRGTDADSLIADPDLKDRYEQNRVPAGDTFKEKHLPTFQKAWAGMTRTIPELPNDPRYAPLRSLFREFRSLDGVAAAKRTFIIQEQLSGLSRPEYERLSEVVFLRNMAANVKRQKAAFTEKNGNLNGFEARLPSGWTEAKLDASLKNVDDLFAKGGAVKDAFDGLETARAKVTGELKSLHKAVTGRDLALDLEDYHHQAIIAYAKGKAGSSGKGTGKPGFMKNRDVEGHDLDYYTDFIEHESRWLESAVRKVQTLKLWKVLLDDYDITKEVRARAAQLNDKVFLPSLQALAAGTASPGTAGKLAKLAAEDGLPDHVDSRFSGLLDDLEDLELNGTPLSPESEALLPAYGKFLTSRPRGQGLGWKPGQLVPEGYKAVPVDEISNIFAANAVSQKIAQEAQMLAGSAVGISKDDLRKVMAMGRRKEIIVPIEVANTLEAFQSWSGNDWETGVSRGIRRAMGVWKAEKLINPLRGAGYWIGNAISDTDALFQGIGLKAMAGRVPKAAAQVGKLLAGQAPSKNLRVWVEKGGLSGLLAGQEGVGTGVMGADPLGKFSPRRAGKLGKAWNTGMALAKLPHDWREATGRFAAFEEFLDQIERDLKAGGAGAPDGWGASNPAEVMALKDKYDRAYKLANDLVGNYDEITAAGRYIRGHIVPFYSWWEVNTRRQLRLYRNAWESPRIAAAYGKKVAGGPIPVAQAVALGRFALKAGTLALMIDAANEYFFPEERRELGDKKRGRPVLIVGRDANGKVLTYDRLGNLPELQSWFGLDNHGFSPVAAAKAGDLKAGVVGGYAEAWLNGRMTIGEIGQDMGMALVKKAGGGIGPVKVAAEVATGKNLMDVTDPSPNINRWDPLWQTIGFGLPAIQRHLEGRPARPGQGKVLDRPYLGYKTVDLSEEAYNDARGHAHEWLAKRGKARAMAVPTGDRGIALYWHKKALKYGDTKTAAVKLREYAATATEDDYVSSLKKLSPLSALSTAEQKEFVESLAAPDLARLRRAYIHYQQLVAGDISAERVARLERIIHAEQPAEGTRTPLEWQRRRTYLWIQRLAEGRTKQAKGIIERHLERHNPLKEMAKDDRDLKRQLRKNERAKRQARKGR
jgi:hypothetical protein